MHITAQGPRLRNDLYCVELDVKPWYAIPRTTKFDRITHVEEGRISRGQLRLYRKGTGPKRNPI